MAGRFFAGDRVQKRLRVDKERQASAKRESAEHEASAERHDQERRAFYCTEIAFAVGVASKTSVEGHVGHFAPSAALFGSPLAAKAPMVRIIASDSASRPGCR